MFVGMCDFLQVIQVFHKMTQTEGGEGIYMVSEISTYTNIIT